jgi:hypothetical protein
VSHTELFERVVNDPEVRAAVQEATADALSAGKLPPGSLLVDLDNMVTHDDAVVAAQKLAVAMGCRSTEPVSNPYNDWWRDVVRPRSARFRDALAAERADVPSVWTLLPGPPGGRKTAEPHARHEDLLDPPGARAPGAGRTPDALRGEHAVPGV